ncbi:hypothetical protein BDW69DRAFT_174826, partial [Aspergillus filifer]
MPTSTPAHARSQPPDPPRKPPPNPYTTPQSANAQAETHAIFATSLREISRIIQRTPSKRSRRRINPVATGFNRFERLGPRLRPRPRPHQRRSPKSFNAGVTRPACQAACRGFGMTLMSTAILTVRPCRAVTATAVQSSERQVDGWLFEGKCDNMSPSSYVTSAILTRAESLRVIDGPMDTDG